MCFKTVLYQEYTQFSLLRMLTIKSVLFPGKKIGESTYLAESSGEHQYRTVCSLWYGKSYNNFTLIIFVITFVSLFFLRSNILRKFGIIHNSSSNLVKFSIMATFHVI